MKYIKKKQEKNSKIYSVFTSGSNKEHIHICKNYTCENI